MTPPKCRICGIREHNHRCQGGTPVDRMNEARRLQQAYQEEQIMAARGGTPPAGNVRPRGTTLAADGPKPPPEVLREQREPVAYRPGQADAPRRASAPAARTAWHEDSDAEGERVEVRDGRAKQARFYAPFGQCVYCDRRREAARRSMAAVRERGTDA